MHVYMLRAPSMEGRRRGQPQHSRRPSAIGRAEYLGPAVYLVR